MSKKTLGRRIVASDYLHVNAFDDVNGWDLQHVRRVRWCRLPAEHAFGSSVFGANPPRCSRVFHEEVVPWCTTRDLGQ